MTEWSRRLVLIDESCSGAARNGRQSIRWSSFRHKSNSQPERCWPARRRRWPGPAPWRLRLPFCSSIHPRHISIERRLLRADNMREVHEFERQREFFATSLFLSQLLGHLLEILRHLAAILGRNARLGLPRRVSLCGCGAITQPRLLRRGRRCLWRRLATADYRDPGSSARKSSAAIRTCRRCADPASEPNTRRRRRIQIRRRITAVSGARFHAEHGQHLL